VLHVDVVEALFKIQDLLGVKHDISRLPLEAARGLVNHDANVRQGEPQVFGSGREQERAHGGRLPDAQRRHRRAHELHRVVDRKSGGHDAARGVNVHADLFLRIVGLQKEQLGDHQHRHRVLDRAGDENDAFLEQPRLDVVGTLASVGLLHYHRHEIVHISINDIRHH
jgi:hypothetical protein